MILAISLVYLLAAPPTSAPESLLDAGYRQMYNLDFEAAHKTFAEWMRLNPHDPLGPASDAAGYLFSELERLNILQAEFFLHDEEFRTAKRLSPDPAVQKAFRGQIARADQLSKQALARDPRDANALFAGVLILGLQADYDGLIEKRYLASLTRTKNGRLAAERLLAVDPNCYDAWLAIGVENYLLSLKPLPLRWILQLGGNQTDRSVGIEKLRLTAEKGRYFRPFAQLLLAVAALRDNNRSEARAILQRLATQFPRNHLYAGELARLR
jgi:tetratricopeptide (TPR) repeat protein